MGSAQSVQVPEEEEEESEDGEQEEDDDDNGVGITRDIDANNLIKKVLEQEPEMLLCHTSEGLVFSFADQWEY